MSIAFLLACVAAGADEDDDVCAEVSGGRSAVRGGDGDAAGGVHADGADQVRGGRGGGGERVIAGGGGVRSPDGVPPAAQRAGSVPQLGAPGGRGAHARQVPDNEARLRRLLQAGGEPRPATGQVR